MSKRAERKAQRRREKEQRRKELAPARRRARRERRKKYKMIFINGKQKWVPREPTIDGMPVDEFIARNADPIWLHQNEMWELIEPDDYCFHCDYADESGLALFSRRIG